MKKLVIPALMFIIMAVACGRGAKSDSRYPAEFKSMTDSQRLSYMMGHVSADSVARFLIDGALGRNPDAPIDSLATATLFVYENLKGAAVDTFSTQYDNYVADLPLDDKMKVYMMAGTDDPQRLGYKLGLEYLGSVRESNKNANQVESELMAFKKACGADTATYKRFIIGFHTALAVDSGKDISNEIYSRFINYE